MFAEILVSRARGVALTTLGTIALAHPTNAHAQRRIEIAPALGAYVPTHHLPLGPGDIFFVGGACRGGGPPCPPAVPESQTRTVAVGGRVTAWLSNRAAIETSFRYAASGVKFVSATPELVDSTVVQRGTIIVADLRLLLALAPQARSKSLIFMGGPAVIRRSGDVYADVRGTTSPGGVLGVGLDIHPGHRVGLRAQIDDYLYTVKFASGTGPEVGSWRFQQDVVLSLSLNPFRQRGERR
jgi:hypothetical protein